MIVPSVSARLPLTIRAECEEIIEQRLGCSPAVNILVRDAGISSEAGATGPRQSRKVRRVPSYPPSVCTTQVARFVCLLALVFSGALAACERTSEPAKVAAASGPSTPRVQQTLRIAAASDLSHVMHALVTGFLESGVNSSRERDAGVPRVEELVPAGEATDASVVNMRDGKDAGLGHPDHITTSRVEPVFGSSGSLLAQIMQGAPFDVYMSADEEYTKTLIREGYGDEDSYVIYAHGSLALWARDGALLDIAGRGAAALEDSSVVKIALANPVHAPYGRAAVAVLENLGLLEKLRPKLVFGENAAQAMQFVDSGGAQVGVVGRALALSRVRTGRGSMWPIPESLHPPMAQAAVALVAKKVRSGDDRAALSGRVEPERGAAKENTAAHAWCLWLRSEEAQRILAEAGYGASQR